MSGDEVLILIISLAAGLLLWGKWFGLCFSLEDFGRNKGGRMLGAAVPLAAFGLIFCGLRLYASHDVRDDGVYLFFYTVMGATWLAVTTCLADLCGLSLRDDWLERGNPSATALGIGLLLGTACAFTGANIGDGPGWWVVLFCGLLATGAVFIAWWLYDEISNAVEHVVVDRDFCAGARLGAFLLAAGIIAGRSVAGDWTGASGAFFDFVGDAWPLLPYTFAAGLIERALYRRPRSPRPRLHAVFSFLIHMGLALLFLKWAGPWK